VKTGIGALLMPGIKVGCNSRIGPGVVVYRDVPADTTLLLKQNLEEKKRGS
jgi:bifunctional UDP-N-acetylglucosamine pyrophosphorylase/glucosamine-1-phosphate N-acetyltransferase